MQHIRSQPGLRHGVLRFLSRPASFATSSTLNNNRMVAPVSQTPQLRHFHTKDKDTLKSKTLQTDKEEAAGKIEEKLQDIAGKVDELELEVEEIENVINVNELKRVRRALNATIGLVLFCSFVAYIEHKRRLRRQSWFEWLKKHLMEQQLLMEVNDDPKLVYVHTIEDLNGYAVLGNPRDPDYLTWSALLELIKNNAVKNIWVMEMDGEHAALVKAKDQRTYYLTVGAIFADTLSKACDKMGITPKDRPSVNYVILPGMGFFQFISFSVILILLLTGRWRVQQMLKKCTKIASGRMLHKAVVNGI